MNCGIYQILNIKNNKRYIGSSKHIYKRLWDHQKKLKINTHPNQHLQNSYNKYGKNVFKFKQLIECKEQDLLFYENLIIKGYKSNNPEFGYNIREVVESNKNLRSLKYQPGDKYNRITLIKRVKGKNTNPMWLCKCDCGTEWNVSVYHVRKGITKSCGCLNKELATLLFTKLHSDPIWHEKRREISRKTMTRTQARLRKERSLNG